jgi:hypothetical protein
MSYKSELFCEKAYVSAPSVYVCVHEEGGSKTVVRGPALKFLPTMVGTYEEERKGREDDAQ